MLERFRKAKDPEIAALRELAAKDQLPEPWRGERPDFAAALLDKGPGAVIAEYKRASPSKGLINDKLSAGDVARAYQAGGAAAMSVLTEVDHFQGSLDFLFEAHTATREAGLPLLRKDFLYDPLQVAATAATPASALLLIARCFDRAHKLGAMLHAAREAGIAAVVEIFDEKDLDMARDAGAVIIQVNNRDLSTLKVDLDVSERLARRMGDNPGRELWISASGITARDQVLGMAELGYQAVLVGTWLMEGGLMEGDDPELRLRDLTGTS